MNDRKVHLFFLDEAVKYGAEAAAILYNIRFWLDKNKAVNKHIHDGRVWTFNSAASFSELFPYLTEKQIRNRLQKLIDAGILLSGNFNRSAYDRTLWYSVDETGYCIFPNGKMDSPNEEDENPQEGTPIPDSKLDSKTDSKKEIKEKVSGGISQLKDIPQLGEAPAEGIHQAYCRIKEETKDMSTEERRNLDPVVKMGLMLYEKLSNGREMFATSSFDWFKQVRAAIQGHHPNGLNERDWFIYTASAHYAGQSEFWNKIITDPRTFFSKAFKLWEQCKAESPGAGVEADRLLKKKKLEETTA